MERTLTYPKLNSNRQTCAGYGYGSCAYLTLHREMVQEILAFAWNGEHQAPGLQHLGWPLPGKPSHHHWLQWQKCWEHFTQPRHPCRLQQPLQDWMTSDISHSPWLLCGTTNSLWKKTSEGFQEYRQLTTRQTRYHRYERTDLIRQQLPTSVQRTHPQTLANNQVCTTGTSPTTPTENNRDPTPHWSVERCSIPDNVTRLVEGIRNGTAVAIADGSYKAHRGTAAFVIQADQAPEGRIIGCNHTPGDPEDQTAFRSETGGNYGIFYSVRQLVQQHQIESGRIELGGDCLSGLQQIFGDKPLDPSCADFDLLQDIRGMLEESPLQWIWVHIKGHQDKHHSYESLDWRAQTNVQMDNLATAFWTECEEEDRPRLHPPSLFGWSLWCKERKLSNWRMEQLYDLTHDEKTREYWQAKYRFPPASQPKIDWKHIAIAAKQLGIWPRIRQAKWGTNFHPTNQILQRRKQVPDDKCPRCEEIETREHVLRCDGYGATDSWDAAVSKLSAWMQQTSTHPAIRDVIVSRLRSWHDQQPLETRNWYQAGPAAAAQDQIGWWSFLQGFVATEWGETQAEYFRWLKLKRTSKRWVTALIKKLWEISWTLWEHRCAIQEDPALPPQMNEHNFLNAQIAEEYQTGPGATWRPLELRWLERPIDHVYSESLDFKTNWLCHMSILRARNMRRRPRATHDQVHG